MFFCLFGWLTSPSPLSLSLCRYLPLDEDYCVYAQYTVTAPQRVSVTNYANKDMVNGQVKGGNLCAVIPDASQPAKLKVGPCFLPSFLYGPYWVVAAGPTPDNYEWAIISGGQPTHDTGNGCTTGSGVNNSGFWYFSRDPVADPSVIDMLERIAVSKGFDTSVLNVVQQDGCTYHQDEAPASNFMKMLGAY